MTLSKNIWVFSLSAYGTYKLAKKMTSGIRQAYDNDDCWEYNLFRGHYECKCQNNQCYEYANSAAALGHTQSPDGDPSSGVSARSANSRT